MWSLRAAPRNYQLDAEKVKKLPGLKLSQNKAYGPYLQNRWFKYDRVNNIFLTNFLLPEAYNGQKSCEIRVIFSNSYILK